MCRRTYKFRLPLLTLATLLLTGPWTAGCGDRTAGNGALETARDAELGKIRAAKSALDARRAELAGLRATPAAVDAGEAAATTAEVSSVAVLEKQITAQADALGEQIVVLLNADPPTEGEQPSARQSELVALKIDEDIILAREYIEEGGDYRGAIEIYQRGLALDPGNARLVEELAHAERDRYMTAERFAQATKGMTEAEVRAVLGQANAYNVRPYPEKGVVAWFYPRADGAAAGVFFERREAGLVVYQTNFDAVGVKAAGESPPS